MPSFSKNEIVLVRYPFSDLTNLKVRPAVVVNAPHVSKDLFIVALIHKKDDRFRKEFEKWAILLSLKAIQFDSVGCKPDVVMREIHRPCKGQITPIII